MVTKELHLSGFDPGGTSAYALLTVSRYCIFADEEPAILEWDYGELNGPETKQALEFARLCREWQGLAYKCGPAVVSERWDADPGFKNTDQEQYSPIRINAMLQLLWDEFPHLRGDATLHFQSRTQAFRAFNDERLRSRGLWVEGSEHIRAATKHALTALRRARENAAFAHELWPYPASGLP